MGIRGGVKEQGKEVESRSGVRRWGQGVVEGLGLRDGVGGGLVIRTVCNFDDVEPQCYVMLYIRT